MARLLLSILGILIILIFGASFIANILFNRNVTKEVGELFNSSPADKNEIVRPADLTGLPPCVQKWLENSGVVGKEKIHTVRLKQKGVIRLDKDKPWMPLEAEQYFTVDKPGFIWKAKVKMAPFIYFAGRDKYYDGKGTMLIKVLSVVPVVNAKGKELDQGVLLRYLAETVWFPSAVLSDYIKWEAIDAHSARATMSYGGVTASGVFMFNEKGDMINFVAKRYMEKGGKYSLETWSTPAKGYREFAGVRIPNKAEAVWKLKIGDFTWYQGEITEVEYNKPFIY